MPLEPRLPCLGLCALLLAPGCANTNATGSWSVSDDDGAPAALTAEERGDLECARRVRAEKQRICDDAPPSLPESYTSRSRESYERLEQECADGMRASAELRVLDDCLFALEEDPSQIDLRLKTRREEAGDAVAAVKADPLYPRAKRRLKETREEADLAAEEYERAKRGASESQVRFRADAWEQAETDLRNARRQLLELMTKHGVDPRDARALGVW